MTARHLEVLVEEESMEALLDSLLPRLVPGVSFKIHRFQGKHDLLKKLPQRMRGYRKTLQPGWRIIVVVDRDNDDCQELKQYLEGEAAAAGLHTRTAVGISDWEVANRIAVEELEAWYFGDWSAVQAAYPRLGTNVPRQSSYRDPENIRGGTWEAFERVLKSRGYFKTGLRKVEAATEISQHLSLRGNRCPSFEHFVTAVREV